MFGGIFDHLLGFINPDGEVNSLDISADVFSRTVERNTQRSKPKGVDADYSSPFVKESSTTVAVVDENRHLENLIVLKLGSRSTDHALGERTRIIQIWHCLPSS